MPANLNGLIRRLFEIIDRTDAAGVHAVQERSGLADGSLTRWRAGQSPHVHNLEAALNALGYELVVRPMADPALEAAQQWYRDRRVIMKRRRDIRREISFRERDRGIA